MRNLGIGAKVFFSTGVLAFGYLLFLCLVQVTGSNIREHVRIASNSLFPAALASQEAQAEFQKLIKDYKDAVLLQDSKALATADEDAQKVAASLQEVLAKSASSTEIRQKVSGIQDGFKRFATLAKTTYAAVVQKPDSLDSETQNAMKTLADESAQLTASLRDLNDSFSSRALPAELNAVEAGISHQRLLTLLLFAVAVAFAVFTTHTLREQIAVPLALAVGALKELADGDLTASLEVNSSDEVGRMAQSLNDALEKLRATLGEVAETAATAATSSQQLAGSAESIASGAQTQAAGLEQTSASLEQITATVRQTAENARQASQLAIGSRESAEKGQDVVAGAIAAMIEINTASAKISEIISTINEIAFQTNLLAVNAAVEAARAGEDGRGFAVVATEVRSLAQRSAGASKQIKSLIQDTLAKVEKGSALVNQSGERLQGIVSSVQRVTDIVGEIAVASGEQSAGVEQVSSAMNQMDQVTQSNSAVTAELSSTAHSLSQQSSRLLELVGVFKLDQRQGRANGLRKELTNVHTQRRAGRSEPVQLVAPEAARPV
jgi:methyl-accepting chemotaxis protein